ncbi:uncharacterized protein PV07_08468 [Cladophialophora immunda]|uniref:Uncharacterized protein n=1 Tax=Cladophialophora immunda TaxID=569365 RepID=A0A0D2AK19_9EURO|nr:uncharacterized protein PV07_08468 [Cladophialophora immunda]KIW25277.1 hypothetical protein PV07_08468 [Cladophialophora immunda]
MAVAYNRADMFEESYEESKIALAMYRSFKMYKDWKTVPYYAFDDARASYQAAVDMFYAANGNNYKTSQARLKLADHKIREGLLEEAWQDYKLVIEAFERNSHYKRELARTEIKAARLQTLMDNSLLSATLIKQAQALLDELGVSASARSITEAETPRMVRIWSR